MKYRKKHIDAIQWFKNGDHPKDGFGDGEGKFIKYYKERKNENDIHSCGKKFSDHGIIDYVQNDGISLIVCPGDYIVSNYNKFTYDCVPSETFESLYEPDNLDEMRDVFMLFRDLFLSISKVK